jgi:hypothetical protein
MDNSKNLKVFKRTKCTSNINIQQPCLRYLAILHIELFTSLKIIKKINSDHQIQQSHWLGMGTQNK